MSSIEKPPAREPNQGLPNQETVKTSASSSRLSSALRLVSALLRHDAPALFVLFLVAALPHILSYNLHNLSSSGKAGLVLFDIFIDLAILAWVAGRWIPRILWGKEETGTRQRLTFFRVAVLYGFLGFIPLGVLPMFLSDMGLPQGGILWAAVFLIGAACYYFLFRLYFYFLPVFGGLCDSREIFAFAYDMTRERVLLPLAVFLPPLGMIALGAALSETLLFPLPGTWKTLSFVLWSVLAGLLITYLSVAVAITHIPASRLAQLHPSEDWEQRMKSLEAWSIPWLGFFLAPKRSALLFLAAILLWSGTLARNMTTHPGFLLRIESLEAADNTLSVHVLLKDERNTLQNVHPAFFRLAGNAGEPFSERLTQVSLGGELRSPYAALPATREEQRLSLHFEVPRKKQDLPYLKDLFLWYQGVALEKIDFEKMFEK